VGHFTGVSCHRISCRILRVHGLIESKERIACHHTVRYLHCTATRTVAIQCVSPYSACRHTVRIPYLRIDAFFLWGNQLQVLYNDIRKCRFVKNLDDLQKLLTILRKDDICHSTSRMITSVCWSVKTGILMYKYKNTVHFQCAHFMIPIYRCKNIFFRFSG
jgi:hypothetical protein